MRSSSRDICDLSWPLLCSEFGRVFTCEVGSDTAVYVPRDVGNAYQALEDRTAYCYLVDAHWLAELKGAYTFGNLADPELGIKWFTPLGRCDVSEADKNHPMLADVKPMAPKRTLMTGDNGQLGRAARARGEERGVAEYCATVKDPVAPRPEHSALDLSKLEAVGFCMPGWEQLLIPYIKF